MAGFENNRGAGDILPGTGSQEVGAELVEQLDPVPHQNRLRGSGRPKTITTSWSSCDDLGPTRCVVHGSLIAKVLSRGAASGSKPEAAPFFLGRIDQELWPMGTNTQSDIIQTKDVLSPHPPWRVRLATVADLTGLLLLATEFARQTETSSFDPDTARAGILAALRDPDRHGQFVVVEDGDRAVIGQAMLIRVWDEWQNGFVLEITSVCVTEPWRRRGVCSALLQYAEDFARSQDTVLLRLAVKVDNTAAFAAYRKHGFQGTDLVVLEKQVVQSDGTANRL